MQVQQDEHWNDDIVIIHLNTASKTIFAKYGIDNCKISEIFQKKCCKTERDKIEAEYIRQYQNDDKYNCVNICIPCRYGQQYYMDNKEKIQQYQIDNKEKIKQYRIENENIINIKKQQYRDNHKEELNLKSRNHYIDNIEKVNQKCICDKCGTQYVLRTKSRHEKSNKHQQTIANGNIV